jgi:hypothetical protein
MISEAVHERNRTGDVLTWVFPVVLFVGVMIWGFFQRSRR